MLRKPAYFCLQNVMQHLRYYLLILLISLLVSCGSNQDDIYGMWEYVGSQPKISNSLIGGFGSSQEKYWNISESEISIYSSMNIYQGAMEFTIQGDTLSLNEKNKMLFKRNEDTLRIKFILPSEENLWRVFKRQ